MNNVFSLLRYKKSDREEVFAFLRTVYPSIGSDRLINQWNWKYDAHPFNRHNEPYLLMCKDGARMIGMVGAIPLRVSIGGETHWVANICDFIFHPDYHGWGIWRRYFAQFRADNPMWFAWMNEISHRAVAPLGTSRSARIIPLVKPLDFGQILQRMTDSRLLCRWGALLATIVRHPIPLLRRRSALAGVTVTQVASFDQRSDSLWQRVQRDYPVMVVRDQSYLNWRFVCRSDTKYTILLATRGSDLVGYLVFRSTEKDGVRWGYLVDFLVEDSSSSQLALLVEEAIECLRQECIAAIRCLATASSYQHTLYRHGFHPWRWGPRGYFYPHADLLELALQIFRDARHWFLTMADGDLEMSL